MVDEVRGAGLEEVEAEAAWYRCLFEQAPLPAVLYDPETREILAVNRLGAEHFGASREELEGAQLDDYLDPDRAHLVASTIPALPESPMRMGVRRHRRADGRIIDVEVATASVARGSRRARLSIYLDVTDREQAVTALGKNEARFRALVENGDEAIMLLDRDGRILYASPASARILGYDPESFLENVPGDYLHPDDRARSDEVLARCIASPGVPMHFEARYRHRDGSWHHLSLTRTSYLDDPAVGAIVSNFHDVSHRHDLEAQLRLADRMASVGTLAAGVAHEINNPLAYLMANLSFVEDTLHAHADALGADAEEVLTALREARDGGTRVADIVRDLKTFSRTEATVRGPVDVHSVIEAMCAIANNDIRHRARLLKEYAPDLPLANADEPKLAQVVLNLLVNAVQAIPESATDVNQITVRTARADDGEVLIEVSDTGAGIPDDVGDRIFDPFFTTKAVGVGTGLGLSICRNVIESFGGTIDFETELGRGTTFRLRLPAAEAGPPSPEPPAPGPAPVRDPETPSARGRILVVDDEPLIGHAVTRILEDLHDVTTVDSGAAALMRLKSETFDVVLCDLMMPRMSGMAFYRALGEIAPALRDRVVFMTGGAFTPDAARFLDEVSAPQVDKPFRATALRALITRIVGEHQEASG